MATRQEIYAQNVRNLIDAEYAAIGVAEQLLIQRIQDLRELYVRRLLEIPIDSFTAAQVLQVERGMRSAVEALMVDVSAQVQVLIDETVQSGVQKILGPMSAVGFDGLPRIQVSQNLVNAAVRFTTDAIRVETMSVISNIGAEVRKAALLGQTPAQAISQIEGFLDTPGAGPATFGSLQSRAVTILRTETLTLYSVVAQQQMRATSTLIPGMRKMWLHTGIGVLDPRHYHQTFSGTVVPVDEKFMVPNRKGGIDPMDFPRDPSAPAHQIVNCACTVEEVFPGEKEAEALGMNAPLPAQSIEQATKLAQNMQI